MSDKILETQERLKELGYFASEDLSKIVLLFEAAGKRSEKNIPTLLLEGKSGAGKTFLAETFCQMVDADEKFVQCFPRMGTENFQYDVNIEGVMKGDADKAIKEGILLQALQQSHKGPVVLVIDELDKARPEVDSFLLDFLENGRLTTGTDIYERGKYPIYTFITSNDKREIDEALINRSRRVEVPRPEKELFLEILGLEENHYLAYIYDKCPDFSIRQARQYLSDLEVLGKEIDEEALSQYINLDALQVKSLADLQHITEIENFGMEVELPDLERCWIDINDENEQGWSKIFKEGNEGEFKIHATGPSDGRVLVEIDTVEQLQLASQYMDFTSYSNRYRGWFEYSLTEEERQSENIIWAEDKSGIDGTKFGVKIVGESMFDIVSSKGNTFVYLDSNTARTLENFLEDSQNQRYDTDSEYGDEDRG